MDGGLVAVEIHTGNFDSALQHASIICKAYMQGMQINLRERINEGSHACYPRCGAL